MGGLSNIIDKAESLPGGKWADPIKAVTGVDVIGDLSGKPQQQAAADAARYQYAGTLAGIDEQRLGRTERRQDLQPFTQLGVRGIDPLQTMAASPYQFRPQTDPALNFINAETMRQVQDSAAAGGKLNSGGTLAALADRIAGNTAQYTTQQRQLGLAERANRFDELYNLVTLGQNSAAGQGAATADSANAITDLLGQGANAQAAGVMGAANAQAQGTQNMVGLAAMAAAAFSDERLKEDVERVGKMDDGTPIYTYRYKGDPKHHMGVMAQEAKKKHPEAVVKDPLSKMLMVNYGALH